MEIWKLAGNGMSWRKKPFADFPNSKPLFDLINAHVEETRVSKRPVGQHYIVFSKSEVEQMETLLAPFFHIEGAQAADILDVILSPLKRVMAPVPFATYVMGDPTKRLMDKNNALHLGIVFNR